MEEQVIYVDGNGFQYVKGDMGGGNALYWDGGHYSINQSKLWDYCNDVTEEQVTRLCKNTKKLFSK